MSKTNRSSRQRYENYLNKRKKADNRVAVGDHSTAEDEQRAKQRHRTTTGLLKTFWSLLKGKRPTLAACLGLVTISTGLGLIVPLSTKFVIDYVLTDNPGPEGIAAYLPSLDFTQMQADLMKRWPLLVYAGAAVLLLSLTSASFNLAARFKTTMLTKWLQVSLRRRAFEHAVRLPLTRVSDLKSGGAASLLREDAGAAGELLFSFILNPFRAFIQLLGTLVILALVDWRMLAGALLLIPIVIITNRTWIARIRPVYRDIRRTRQAIDAQATEAFGGMRVVRGFHRGQAEAARFSRNTHYMTRQEILAWWWTRLIEQAWEVIIPLASAAVLLYGGYRVLGENLTVGDLMAFSAYVLMLLGPIESLVSTAAQIQTNLAGLDRTLDVLEEPQEFENVTPPDQIKPIDRATTRGRIALEDVYFRYPPRQSRRKKDENTPTELPHVLKGITLTAEPGTTVAFVGASGSGKTTLCNLIARFYDPTAGRVTLDGDDLRNLDLDGYRRLLGIVEQDVFLFDGSVAENIAYAKRGASQDDIVAAAEAANAHGFITELEDGYDTLLGERGVRLSGGQKQRIAIARAVLADPAILILDEATSNLDSESERLIQASLAELMQGRTSFVIAHRLSTIRHADQIVVLEKGELIESGTHQELIDRDGRYAHLLRLQLDQQPTA
ncbi:MAG: ABC transporter ATP-binding protein [Planctomycetota bacterium]